MTGRPLQLTPAEQLQLALDWPTMPPRELARRYRVSLPTLYAYRRKLGLAKRGRNGRPFLGQPAVKKRIAPKRVYKPRTPTPEPQAFPFRYIPPREARPTRWRCDCGGLSETGPECARCATRQPREAA